MLSDFSDYIKSKPFVELEKTITDDYQHYIYKIDKKKNSYKLIIKTNQLLDAKNIMNEKYKDKNMDNYYFIILKIEFHKYKTNDKFLGGPISILSTVYLLVKNKLQKALKYEKHLDHDLHFDITGRIWFGPGYLMKKEKIFIKNLPSYLDNIINKLMNKEVKIAKLGHTYYNVKF
jgi:hypothetical protein